MRDRSGLLEPGEEKIDWAAMAGRRTKELDEANARIAALERQFKQVDDRYNALRNEYAGKCYELYESSRDNYELGKKLKQTEEERVNWNKVTAILQAERDTAREEIEMLNKGTEQCCVEIANLNDELKQTEEERDRLKELSGTAHHLNRIAALERQLKQTEEERDSWKRKAEEMWSGAVPIHHYTDLEAERDRLKAQLYTIDKIKDSIRLERDEMLVELARLKESEARYSEIGAERKRQDEKWGQQNHEDPYWLGILVEEVGELAKEIIEGNHALSRRRELVQVAAVAVAWIECMERRAGYTHLSALASDTATPKGGMYWYCQIHKRGEGWTTTVPEPPITDPVCRCPDTATREGN
jgi:chromosome segregation ATPase